MPEKTTSDIWSKSDTVQFTTKVDVFSNYIRCQVFCQHKNVDYAFYLVVDGSTVVKRWYNEESSCSFRLEFDRTKEHSIIFFVRDSVGTVVKKTEKINQHDIDFLPSCFIEGKSIRCQIETTQSNAEYAFYLYINDEEVIKKWYTHEKYAVFEITNEPIQSFRIKYFIRDKQMNVYSKIDGFERYKPDVNDDRSRTNFDFFLSIDGLIIYKKVKSGDTRFAAKLQDHGGVEQFRQILNSDVSSSISNHITKGFDIENDGSYKSKYIHGYRLDLLSSLIREYQSLNLPSKEERKNIEIQCSKLISALKESAAAEVLIGDWALHNLIYSPQDDCIFNIDLEGFITYNPLPEWANLDQILKWIEEFMVLLES